MQANMGGDEGLKPPGSSNDGVASGRLTSVDISALLGWADVSDGLIDKVPSSALHGTGSIMSTMQHNSNNGAPVRVDRSLPTVRSIHICMCGHNGVAYSCADWIARHALTGNCN
jgi:hypothetical protein